MVYTSLVKNCFCYAIILVSSILIGCTPFKPAPHNDSAEANSKTRLDNNTVDCAHPETVEPANEAPASTWPTAVCPKAEEKKCPICPAAIAGNKALLGEYELVSIDPPGFEYLARIDTGATSTSIHAYDIKRFERDGDNWVRFKINNTQTKEEVALERKLVRRVRIKQVDAAGDSRLTVILTLKIGKLVKQVEVSLTDRSNMEFPVLIGRNYLLDTAVVDVSLRRIAR